MLLPSVRPAETGGTDRFFLDFHKGRYMRHFNTSPATGTGRNDWKTLRSLLPYLWAFKGRVIAALACLVLAKVAIVGVPLVLKEVVDHLNTDDNAAVTVPLALILGYGALRLLSSLFGELRDVIFARVTQHTIRRISRNVFEHLHRLSLRFHLQRRTGGVSRDIERGARGISFLLAFMVFNILPTLLEITLVSAILYTQYGARFALVAFLSLAGYVVYSLLITEWRMRFRREMNERDSATNTHAIDSLLNYETVKYFNNEHFETRRYDSHLASWETAAVKNQTSLAVLNAGQGTIIAAGMTAMMWLAADGVTRGELSLGDLVAINAFLLQLFMPLNFLGFVYREIKHSLADMEKMFGLLHHEPDIQDRPHARPLTCREAEVRFEHVRFAYDEHRPILRDVSFTIPAGTKVAVVGPSGAGKSTLARLLFRFYDVSGGAILINGHDIRDLTQASLRAAIGIVPQDTVLFNDTVYYNIAYGRPEATPEQVTAAARTAHLHDFIESLPDGYDTLVGERGLKLSGGEKQRVAIARTILKNPPILIFDEATSALDSNAERAIVEAMREISQQHTTLIIAHRLSTVVDADTIVVLDEGRIIEQGTHEQLLKQAGLYRQMWRLQQEQQPRHTDPDTALSGHLGYNRTDRHQSRP